MALALEREHRSVGAPSHAAVHEREPDQQKQRRTLTTAAAAIAATTYATTVAVPAQEVPSAFCMEEAALPWACLQDVLRNRSGAVPSRGRRRSAS
eukprot:1384278-Alexandrium_andersonii.AAC.1